MVWLLGFLKLLFQIQLVLLYLLSIMMVVPWIHIVVMVYVMVMRMQNLVQKIVVVVAGMEGALPSVVGGWVSCPVVAVPTSVGYGAALGGLAALLGMLNSCAANVTVVNIDAGFKAGFVAGLIARGSAGGDVQSDVHPE